MMAAKRRVRHTCQAAGKLSTTSRAQLSGRIS